MESDVYVLTVVVALLYIAHLIITSPTKHTIILVAVFIIITHQAYTWHKQQMLQGVTTQSRIEAAANLSDHARMKEGSINIGGTSDTVKMLIASDDILLDALKKLDEFKKVSEEVTTKSTMLLFQFYENYVKILMKKTHEIDDITIHELADLRRSLLNTLSTLHIQASKNEKKINEIILAIQSCTYRCMNVIKNKFDVIQHVPPIPSNTVDSRGFELF